MQNRTYGILIPPCQISQHDTLITAGLLGIWWNKPQIWPCTEIQHSMVAPPSGAEQKLNAHAQLQIFPCPTPLDIFKNLDGWMVTHTVFTNFHLRVWWTKTNKKHQASYSPFPNSMHRPSSTILTGWYRKSITFLHLGTFSDPINLRR